MKVLVTGAAGFIGAHCVHRLAQDRHEVQGLDNFNSYYDPRLKHDRIDWIRQAADIPIHDLDLADADGLTRLFAQFRPEVVINLAAQAGVRYSLQNPRAYCDSNLVGFLNLLECCRAYPVRHLLYASSSSVYGANQRTPYAVTDNTDHPLSLYAATKKANEVLAHSYSHLFGIPSTGLRFFTVYGPWGRPDMSPALFARAIATGEPLKLFNHGHHRRDFTHIDDIVEALIRLLEKPPAADPDWDAVTPDPSTSAAPWRLLNIGGQRPVALLDYVAMLERLLGRKAVVELLPLQPGDVYETAADTRALEQLTDFSPRIELGSGLASFIDWFSDYYSLKPD